MRLVPKRGVALMCGRPLPDPFTPRDQPFCGMWTPCVYLSAEDSTSGLCHTPGTREGVKSHRGSNPLSSATRTPRCPRTRGFSHVRGRFRRVRHVGITHPEVAADPPDQPLTARCAQPTPRLRGRRGQVYIVRRRIRLAAYVTRLERVRELNPTGVQIPYPPPHEPPVSSDPGGSAVRRAHPTRMT